MKKIEDYIREHQKEFEMNPPAGHFERFMQKSGAAALVSEKKSRRRTLLYRRSWMAAACVLLLAVGFYYFYKPVPGISVCERSGDLKMCYIAKMNEEVVRIQGLVNHFNESDRQEVMEEVENIILESDVQRPNIPEELSLKQEQLILDNYYKHNLESLQMISNILREHK